MCATSSLTFTFCEDFFTRPLANPDPRFRTHNNRILPAHGRWLWGGLVIVSTMYPFSILTAAANLVYRAEPQDGLNFVDSAGRQRAAMGFYSAGLVFSLLHFLWGPRAMRLLASIRNDRNSEGDTKRDNTAVMKEWLNLNATRGILADFPGWACDLISWIIIAPMGAR
jgi:hypothetical protein